MSKAQYEARLSELQEKAAKARKALCMGQLEELRAQARDLRQRYEWSRATARMQAQREAQP